MDNIKEGNKLIAAFMGWRLTCLNPGDEEGEMFEYHQFDENVKVIDTHGGGNEWFWNKDSVMEFDYSWDRLMPVGKKCMDLATDQPNRPTQNHCSKLDMVECDISIHVREYNIEGAWKHIVEFIKLYNEKNEKI